MNRKLIVFNWKMAPDSFKEAISLFERTRIYADKTRTNAEIIVAPPFVYLEKLATSAVAKGYGGLRFASQDVFWENPPAGGGAYTGEISVKMLKNLGAEYVIIGHSERRKYLNETDEMINKKVLAALEAELKVILCVGEDLSIRKAGKKAVEKFIKSQLEKDLKGLLGIKNQISNVIIAYEPIWAIGAGHSDTPQDAVEMIRFIKQTLNSIFHILSHKVLYGGSVDSKNIGNFLKHSEIDGALVGHASLRAGEVKKMILLTNSYFTL